MADKDILGTIDELVAEERALRAHGTGLTEADRTRLKSLEQQLDQCWDLLRQRRAAAEFGQDPADATTRTAGEVQGYLQ
ncbi:MULTISPECIES: DUF2630 family protein [unclassified Crossiella]|uniref:DUF2630 family protein n=1 Tax=unclassified Crossiella TaxID=2620835 RepID=UPI001FFEB162|nr:MULTISPECIES: DUF2630 family protein [unclassified Crossiella]MCK2243506.1 DUF2630 family protein [Crossiella sp. S99.2]MCK2257364.1 DUF2630 family protein [Crossiella sp. S99.1]